MSVRKAITPRSPSASLTRTHAALNSHLLCDTMAVLGWQDDSVVGCLQPSLSLIPEPTWFRTYSCRFSLDFHTYEHITYNMYEHMSTHTNLQGIHLSPHISAQICAIPCVGTFRWLPNCIYRLSALSTKLKTLLSAFPLTPLWLCICKLIEQCVYLNDRNNPGPGFRGITAGCPSYSHFCNGCSARPPFTGAKCARFKVLKGTLKKNSLVIQYNLDFKKFQFQDQTS